MANITPYNSQELLQPQLYAHEGPAENSLGDCAYKIIVIAASILGGGLCFGLIPGTPGILFGSIVILTGTSLALGFNRLFDCVNALPDFPPSFTPLSGNIQMMPHGSPRGNPPNQYGARHPVGGTAQQQPIQQHPFGYNPPLQQQSPHLFGQRHPVGNNAAVQQQPPQYGARHPVGGATTEQQQPPHQIGGRHPVQQ
ncbi:MAG: hypothetical protein Tsb0015_01450 [Simkaniaceae bacterium]